MVSIILPSTSVQERVISMRVNSGMLSILLVGIYTSLYLGTAFTYFNRQSSRSLLVLAAITILYVLNLVEAAIEWLSIREILRKNGLPTTELFIFVLEGSNWQTFVDDVCNFIITAVADGLLIWRCYKLWNNSFRVIILSLVFLLAEIGLNISVITFLSVKKLAPTLAAAHKVNNLLSATAFMTLASTLWTTILIAYRIYSVSKHNPSRRGSAPFKKILEIIGQSAVLYSLGSLMYAITGIITPNSSNIWTFSGLVYYSNVLFPIIAGVAPTILVAQVALASSTAAKGQPTSHISDLHFQGDSTEDNVIHAVSTPVKGIKQTEVDEKAELGATPPQHVAPVISHDSF
ncbi:hypothetical protein HYPSUDRAFT_44996 [Hypholoma sublateritium FD-334 SS-4]|uniref:Uncharacterized protein n=1 Tax=Hypholoma sublateritium (strain FD-334 SS-4) TaxID=945553 RepID=A0A0D2PEN8_HYPSF|nr:hypothetical protein HYPSUDRAFT_44996 [Hypholoma sublateritium FD-334 SS-4]